MAKLYPNAETSAKVMDYSIAHSTPLPEHLVKYHKWACEETKVPNFLISTYQAQMLIFLARIVGAKRGKPAPLPCPALTIILPASNCASEEEKCERDICIGREIERDRLLSLLVADSYSQTRAPPHNK